MEEIANRAGNYADPDAGDWMESIYKIANAALARPPAETASFCSRCGGKDPHCYICGIRRSTLAECAKLVNEFDCHLAGYPNDEAKDYYESGVADACNMLEDRINALAAQPPAAPVETEKQIKACMEALEDIPGETLPDRVNRLIDWYQSLSNNYHKDIAEARQSCSAASGPVVGPNMQTTEFDDNSGNEPAWHKVQDQIDQWAQQTLEHEHACAIMSWSDRLAQYLAAPRKLPGIGECTDEMAHAMSRLDGYDRDRDMPTLQHWKDYWDAAIMAAPHLLNEPQASPQTIDTAPKDGSHILAWRIPVGIRVTNNTHPPTTVHWFDDPDEPGFYTSVNERAPEHPFEATHWSPLPAGPSVTRPHGESSASSPAGSAPAQRLPE